MANVIHGAELMISIIRQLVLFAVGKANSDHGSSLS